MGRMRLKYTRGEVPKKLKWRPRLSVIGVILGAIGGLGAVVYMQQSGWRVLDQALSLQGIIGGALSGILIPSVIYVFTVRRYNRRLLRFGRGRRSRAATAMLWVLVFPVVLMFVGTGPALATVEGPCTVTINGVNIASLAPTPGDAIDVNEDDILTGVISHPSELQAGSVDMHYAGLSVTIIDEFDEVINDEDLEDTGARVSTGSAEVSSLATYGTGVYTFFGAALMENGQECSGSFAIKLDTPPLESPVGIAAAVAAGIGVVGAAGVAIGSVREGTQLVNALDEQLDTLPPPSPAEADTYSGDEIEDSILDALETGPTLGGEAPAGAGTADPTDVYSDEQIEDTIMDALGGGPDLGETTPGSGAAGAAPATDLPVDSGEPPGDTSIPDDPGDGGISTDPTQPTGAGEPLSVGGEPVAESATGSGVPGAVLTGGGGSAADGSDFLGRDTADSVSSSVEAINEAAGRADEIAEQFGVSDEVRDEVKGRLQPVGDRLNEIKENAELFRDTVDRAREIGDDTDARLQRLGVNARGRDAITWLRWMFEGIGNHVEGVKNTFLQPVTEPMARVFGGEADDYAAEMVPIGDFGREMSDFVTNAAENIKGGDNYGGQLEELRGQPPDEMFDGIEDVFRFP